MAFSQGATGLSHLPSCLELILGMSVESLQGNHVSLEWIETWGSFVIVARPLEFLSIFKLRPAPLEVRREARDSFTNKAGKWTLISRWGGENWALFELWLDPRCSTQVETVMSGFWDPTWEIPPITSSCGETWWARRVRSQGILCLSIYPETKMKNSPTLCQKFVNATLEDTRIKYEQVYMIHYMGDILIAHPDRVHLQTVLQDLTQALTDRGLKIAPEKIQSIRP